MDIDTMTQKATSTYQTKFLVLPSGDEGKSLKRASSFEEFIKSKKLNLSESQSSLLYVIERLEKCLADASITLPNGAAFNTHLCLENNLHEKSREYNYSSDNNVKIVLAVSGAGKTRMLLELLHSTRGYYFTIQKSSSDFGSFDLTACRNFSDKNPEKAKHAIHLLYFVRVTVCNYLISKGFGEPQTILLAQLHPVSFFGVDVFELLFTALIRDPAFSAFKIIDPFPFVAIDEIQVTTENSVVHLSSTGKLRPFFAPLVYYSKLMNHFPDFFLSGTGMKLFLVLVPYPNHKLNDMQLNF
jgi:hypothetical protein